MKKRALSWLLALCMLVSLAPQALPTWASAAGESDTSESKTETKLSSNTYSALGLSRDVDTSGLDDGKQPYGKADVGNTIATNVINELYVNFNGSIHYGWSILDNIPMQYRDGADIGNNWTSSDNFYGAMGYWRPNQQTVNYKSGKESNGALFAKQGSNPQNGGVHDDHLGKSINSANKHLTYQYSKSEAFSPNTGKDNYVAELMLDSKNDVYLYLYQVENGKKRYVQGQKVTRDDYAGNTDTIIYNWEYDAMYDIAAGDMDGDGYDEIAVYAENHVYLYSFREGELNQLVDTYDVINPSTTSDEIKYKKLKTAVVTLAFGDLNADDKDELVIAENIGYGANNIEEGTVGIYTLGNDNTKDLTKVMNTDISLLIPNSNKIFSNNDIVVRYANVATGDIDGDYQDELIIAGYVSAKNDSAKCNRGDIAYMIVKGDSDNQFQHSEWKAVDKNNNRIDLLDRVVDNEKQLIPPVSLTCAATQGVGHAEQLFLGGWLYSVSLSADMSVTLSPLTRISTNREYKKDNGNKANKEEIFVVNVVAGNFNGNRNGQEQIVYAFGMKHDDSDRYWYDIGYINKKAPGDTDAKDSKGYWYGQEQVMNYESSYNRDSSKARASLYLSLAAVDCDNDSTLMRYKGKTVTWTKPEVLTVLQSAPYFQDLQDTRDYLNQGATSYGSGYGKNETVTTGASLKVGTYVSYEQDFSIFGVKVASIQAEAQSTHEFEYGFQATKEKSIDITYSGSAGDDYAVVYAVPYMEYQYETWVPGYTLQGDNYVNYLNTYLSQKLGKKENQITDEERTKAAKELGVTQNTTVEGSWQPSSVMVPMEPKKVLISVDSYDEIAEQTEGLEPIRGNILNSTPGEPATYDTFDSRDGFERIGADQAVTTGEGGNVSVGGAQATEKAHNFNYSYEFEAKVGAGAGGLTVGVLGGFGTNVGGGFAESTSKSCVATVDNLPSDANKYGFDWRFGTREAKLNGNPVLVLEYQLSNVAQRPSMPKNLRVESVTANSVTLEWDPVVGAGTYKIFQASTTGDNKKRCIATVPGTATSYTDTNVNPNNTYTYCVQNVSQVGGESIYSTDVRAITLTNANGNFVIKQQPGDLRTYVGGTATTTVEAEYLKNGQSQELKYYWERYNTKTKTWDDDSNGSPQLSVSVRNDTVDGTKYRCQVYFDSNLYLYTDPVTLTIGKADSETTLESNKTNQTVNASYVEKKEVTSETEKKKVPHEEKIGEETYLMYTKGDDITVYMKDGKYYSKDDNTVNLIAEEEENVQLTYIVKTKISATTEGGQETETVEEKTISFSAMTKDNTFDPTTKVEYTYQAEPTNTSSDASDGGTGSTDSESETVTYTATEKYKVTNSDVVVYHSYTPAKGEGTSAVDFWFVQSGANKYAADVQTATKLKINEKTKVDVNDLVQAEDEVPVVKTEETYKEGDTVTLTATPKDSAQSGLNLTGKVVFKIVNSVGEGSATVTATIGENGAAAGTAKATWIPTAAGVYTITAEYEGNEKYKGSVSSQTITINVVVPEQKTLMIDSKSTMTYGDAAIDLKTTLLKGATKNESTTESASVDTNLSGVQYTVKESGATISDGKFTPTAAGTYTVTATYTSGSETLTATKSIVVNKRTVTIVPSVNKETKAKSFTLNGIANDTDKSLFKLKTTDNQNGNVDISCDGINTTAAGEYRITVTYTATPAIDKNYIVVCDTTQVYEIKDNVVKVTNATNDSNGSVELKYSLEGSNDLVSVYGTSMEIPKNAKLIAVASPKRGYRVEKWTEKVGEAPEATIFSSGNVYETSNTITIPSEKLRGDKYSIRADFAEVYYDLTIGFQPDKIGSIEAYYLTDDGMKGAPFYSTSPSLTPITATKKLSPLKKVRITATPENNQVISGWRIYSGTDSEGTLVKNDDGTTYTGNTYTVSSINANTRIEIQTETKAAKTIKVTLVGQDGANLGSQASVSFNAQEATSVDGTYTYTTAQHDNVVINLTVPDSLIVNNWTAGEGQTMPGNLSTDKKTLSISNLQDSLNLTVYCKAPNSYGVTVKQMLDGAEVTETAKLPADITIKKNGTDDTVNWSSSDDNKVPEATILRVIIQEKTGYELQSVSCNGEVQTTEDTEGGKAFTINGVHANVNIVATFVKLDEYAITFSVVDTNGDAAGGTNGDLTATAERKGKPYQNFKTGDHVYEGSTVTFTAAPDVGYRVKEWQINNQPKQNYLKETLTLKPEDITENTEVTVQFTPIGDTATFSAGENGRITSVKLGETEVPNFAGGFTLKPGASIEVTAEPAAGYEVEQWLVNGIKQSETGNTFTYTAQATGSVGAAISVSFQQVKYSVTWGGTYGTVVADGYDGSSAEIRGGTDVTFTATPANGYKFDHWTVNGVRDTAATTNTFTWTVPNGKAETPAVTAYNIQAVCVQDTQSYTVTYAAEAPGNGTVTTPGGDGSSITVASGTDLTFTAHPNQYYHVKTWKLDGHPVADSANQNTYTLSNVAGDHTVTVVFDKAVSYTVGYRVEDGNGALTATKNGTALNLTESQTDNIPAGSKLVFTAVPNSGYMVAQRTVINGSTETPVDRDNMKSLGVTMEHYLSNTLTIDSLDKNVTVKVQFKTYEAVSIPTGGTGYKIDATNGRVPAATYTGAPETEIRKNGDLTFTVKPNKTSDKEYNAITKLVVNGYDCIAKSGTATNCDSLEAVKNTDGSYTITIRDIEAIDVDADTRQLVIGGLTTVPEAFTNNDELNTVEKIKAKLEARLTA